MSPTKAQMERVLLRYGRRILEGNERRARGEPNTILTVERYCRALQAVWNMAEAMAETKRKARR